MKKACLSVSIPILLLATAVFINAAGLMTPAGEKQYELKYQMAKGAKFSMTTIGTSSIVTDQMGTEVVADINGTNENIFIILSADNEKGLIVEVEFGESSQKMESTMGSADTDFSTLIGKKARFSLSSLGEVGGYEGFDILPEVITSTGETLTKDLYELGMKATFIKLPEKPVKIGDSWTYSEETDIPLGEYVLKNDDNTTYKVIEEVQMGGHDCLKIEVTGVSQISGEFEQNGTPLSLERETKSKGILYFAYQLGMFIHVESEANAEGVIYVEQAGIEIPQTITSKSTITISFDK